MSEPKVIQIAVGHARGPGEQFGSEVLIVLTDTGEIWERWDQNGCEPQWFKVRLPWEVKEPANGA